MTFASHELHEMECLSSQTYFVLSYGNDKIINNSYL